MPTTHEMLRPTRNWKCLAEGCDTIVLVIGAEGRAIHMNGDEQIYIGHGDIVYCAGAGKGS